MKILIRYLTIILFSIFPILFVYIRNKGFVIEGGLWLPVLLSSGLFSILYFSLNLLNKKTNNNLLILILVSWWFLLYGHVYFYILDLFEIYCTHVLHFKNIKSA